ncbi:MAG: PfkB family carbohydrate kinase [Oscillospiraceae bacterium]|nr:PfkB family carbohydrate kinase [Oscillospiraceae bacterium]
MSIDAGRQFDILCTGMSSIDFIFAGLERMPEPAKEMLCEDFICKPGGAVNTPAALSKLGAKVAFATSLGNDFAGNMVYSFLKESGIDLDAVILSDELRTSVSSVLSICDERAFATYCAKVDINDVLSKIEEFSEKSHYIHSYIDDCLKMPIADVAYRAGAPFSVDAAWDESIRLSDIKDILQRCDVFFVNEVEACSITGKSGYEEAGEELSKYARLVVIKLGANGCMLIEDNKRTLAAAVKVGEVRDTTGCGDAFAAGFLYARVVNGWPPEKSMRLGLITGALTATFYGGVDDLFTREKVMLLYEKSLI